MASLRTHAFIFPGPFMQQARQKRFRASITPALRKRQTPAGTVLSGILQQWNDQPPPTSSPPLSTPGLLPFIWRVRSVPSGPASHVLSTGMSNRQDERTELRETQLIFLPQSEGSHDDHSLSSYKGREATCYCPVVSWCLERFSLFLVLPSVLE